MFKDVYANSFFNRAVRLWSFLPAKCFPLTSDLNCFNSGINTHLLILGLDFLICFNLFVFLFLLTTSPFVVAQPCMEYVPIKKKIIIETKQKLKLQYWIANFWGELVKTLA